MNRTCFILMICMALSCGSPKTSNTAAHEYTGKYMADIPNLLPEGDIKGIYLGKLNTDKRRDYLYTKFQDAIAKNKVWFYTYSTKYKDLSHLPYHSNFNLTKSEYKELIEKSDSSFYVPTDEVEFNIMENERVCYFKGYNGFDKLSALSINTKENVVGYLSLSLPYHDEVHETNPVNKYRSIYNGYKWKLVHDSKDSTENEYLKDIKHGEYEFMLVFLKNSGKRLLEFTTYEENYFEQARQLSIRVQY